MRQTTPARHLQKVLGIDHPFFYLVDTIPISCVKGKRVSKLNIRVKEHDELGGARRRLGGCGGRARSRLCCERGSSSDPNTATRVRDVTDEEISNNERRMSPAYLGNRPRLAGRNIEVKASSRRRPCAEAEFYFVIGSSIFDPDVRRDCGGI